MNNCTARSRVLSWRFCRGRVRVGEELEYSFSVGAVGAVLSFWVEKSNLKGAKQTRANNGTGTLL